MVIDNFLSSFKNKKILITGHTGFKGSWLSLWLNHLGANIVGIALEPKTSKDNYVLSDVSSFVNEYLFDIREKNKLESVIKKEQPEIIFHLAAQPLVLESYINPLETFEINSQGTANILEAIRNSDSVKTAIFITTDKVYENKEWIWPYRETERLGGFDPYSASKGAAEIIISSYRNSFFNPSRYLSHKKSIASVRAGNVIGGGDWSENRIIPDCVRSIEDNRTIEVRNPYAIRPWQHVLEPLGGYILLAARMMEKPEEYSESWNFGPEVENIVNVGRLVNAFISNYGTGDWKDISNPDAQHEANLLSLDINKAKNKLSWRPILDFNQTISLTADWYKNYSNRKPQEICIEQIDLYTKLWKSLNVE